MVESAAEKHVLRANEDRGALRVDVPLATGVVGINQHRRIPESQDRNRREWG